MKHYRHPGNSTLEASGPQRHAYCDMSHRVSFLTMEQANRDHFAKLFARKRPKRARTPSPTAEECSNTSHERTKRPRPTSGPDLPSKLTSPGLRISSPSPSTAEALVTATGFSCHSRSDSGQIDEDRAIQVAHRTILNRDGELSATLLNASELEVFSEEVAAFALQQALRPDHDEQGSIASALKRGPDRYRHLFGTERDRHAASVDAFAKLTRQKEALSQLQAQLNAIMEVSSPEDVIQRVLLEVEGGIISLSKDLKGVRQSDVTEVLLTEIKAGVESLRTCWKDWRSRHPDKTAIRIDNERHFIDPNRRRQTPTLLAYCIALVGRVFEGGSERCTSFLLKMIKIFGRSLVALNPAGETTEQKNAIDEIPETLHALENRLNLGISTVPYAVCKGCKYTYEPTYSAGSSKPTYDEYCSNITVHGLCAEPLLHDDGRPRETFHYYSFLDWFGKFLSLPGIEELGDAFCQHISDHPQNPLVKHDSRDGNFVRHFRANDDGLFVADRGKEGRWFFKLYGDSFNVEGNRIRGAVTSTGVLGLVCLNLPLSMAQDPAYVYIPGLIQGPSEPETKEAAHSYYLNLLMRDLDVAYTRGLAPQYSSRNGLRGVPYERVHRVAKVNAIMDLKAARPHAGFLDATSHHFCYLCDCWHTAHLGRVDFENWHPIDDRLRQKGAALWRKAITLSDRARIEDIYGTRHSAFWTLKYWKPLEQLVPEPMYTFLLRILQNFFREALGLDEPETKGQKIPTTFQAYYYNFAPPPHPTDTTSTGDKPELDISDRLRWFLTLKGSKNDEERVLSLMQWPHLSGNLKKCREDRMVWMKKDILNDKTAFSQLSDVHIALSRPAPTSKPEMTALRRKLMGNKWIVLLYVCNNVMAFPSKTLELQSMIEGKDIVKREMANTLLKWRMNCVQEKGRFQWPFFTAKDGKSPYMAEEGNSLRGHTHETRHHNLSADDRQALLRFLSHTMNHHSAFGIGDIHRKLQQPVQRPLERGFDALYDKLYKETWTSLAYVCVDLNRLPAGVSEIEKEDLVKQLIDWRRSQPTDALKWTQINSVAVLKRLHHIITETVTPSWVRKPPRNSGLAKAGTLKADHWRTLFSIHLPLALLSMWGKHSPIMTGDAEEMSSVLETALLLSCALLAMTKDTLTPESRESFRNLYRQHILGLRENFPGFFMPTHHLAFHIYDFMDSFSTVRNWWSFFFERLIGRLQGLPTNHIIGQFEKSILYGFHSGASFRQWLLRKDCAPLLKYCLNMLDKVEGAVEDNDEDNDSVLTSENHSWNPSNTKHKRLEDWLLKSPLHPELSAALSHKPKLLEKIRCYSRTTAPQGFYTIPGARGIGNSYVCFKDGSTWSAGQVQHIFDYGDDILQIAIKRCLPYSPQGSPDDYFSSFWSRGFEARMVSSGLENKLEILHKDVILAGARIYRVAPACHRRVIRFSRAPAQARRRSSVSSHVELV
ncbi:hypothetical protein D9758_017912 [Tetrapyrgos nigripes]|uniref:Transposase family Tnp2 protein n=1 Tax=Tetrapyrgos nigripes TaxID=182062 RepID=A0A8H5C253_9AGAR|nr:hypothetical protein D9758_017912 [Tetrapyrgos nigripes]